jgi:hypothetical protein
MLGFVESHNKKYFLWYRYKEGSHGEIMLADGTETKSKAPGLLSPQGYSSEGTYLLSSSCFIFEDTRNRGVPLLGYTYIKREHINVNADPSVSAYSDIEVATGIATIGIINLMTGAKTEWEYGFPVGTVTLTSKILSGIGSLLPGIHKYKVRPISPAGAGGMDTISGIAEETLYEDGNAISLEWDKSAGAEFYVVMKYNSETAAWDAIGITSDGKFTDTGKGQNAFYLSYLLSAFERQIPFRPTIGIFNKRGY